MTNKQINGRQCTIYWYVDNTKISHVDYKVVTCVIKSLEGSFGKMTVNRGKYHKSLGMNFGLLKDGKLSMIMKEYLEECIDSFGELGRKIKKTIGSSEIHDLFKVDEKLDILDTERSEMFHHIVACL